MAREFLTPVVLPADPVAPMEAATRQFADEVFIGTVDPYVADPAGKWELWVYEPPPPVAPVLDAVLVPAVAPAQSPTTITLSITNGAALPTTTVHLDGGPAESSAVYVDANTMQFTYDGRHTVGAFVSVTCANGALVSGPAWLSITNPIPPILTSVTPNALTTAGGQVTLNGDDFYDPCIVWWKGSVQIPATYVSKTELTVVLPPEGAGSWTAMVQNAPGNAYSVGVPVVYS